MNYTVLDDIPFTTVVNAKGIEEALKCDIYTPIDEKEELRPVILWIHGGGFKTGRDKKQRYIVELAQEMVQRGYVGVSVDYRVREDTSDKMGTFTDALNDVITAFYWILKHSEQYGIDKNRILVAGGSAGGMIAVNLCLKGVLKEEDRKKITHLLNLWGTPDAFINPHGVDETYPKSLVIHGTADDLVPFKRSEDFVKMLEACGVLHRFYPIEGANHTPMEHKEAIVQYIIAFIDD